MLFHSRVRGKLVPVVVRVKMLACPTFEGIDQKLSKGVVIDDAPFIALKSSWVWISPQGAVGSEGCGRRCPDKALDQKWLVELEEFDLGV